jgi:hypothetical protein
MSKGDNSIPHKETRPVAEGLFNMLDSGASLTTIIGCTAKYCRNFCAIVNTLYMQVFGSAGTSVLLEIALR